MAASDPLVSVIIPAYNAETFVGEAIESALGQSYPNLEVIVCDDASSDGTWDLLCGFADRARVMRNETNRGVGATRNRILKEAKGDYLAFLDADDVWFPDKTRLQVETMQANPEAAVCHTATELFDRDSGDGPISEDRRQSIQGQCFDALFHQNGIVMCSAMVRREYVPAHGFHEDINGVEDYGLWLDMLYGREAVYLPHTLARYRRHTGQATADGSKRIQVRAGIARLRALDQHADRMKADEVARFKAWALEELHTCAYSRYWQGDYAAAAEGFDALSRHDRPAKWRHRAWARARTILAGSGA